MKSEAEREIRDAVVNRLRMHLPGCRIIHELALGGSRTDVAAVTETELYVVEVKSEKDTLKRLKEQMRFARECATGVIIAAHRKFFDETPYANGEPRLIFPEENRYRADKVWCYPEPEESYTTALFHRWDMPFESKWCHPRLNPHGMLSLLLKQELIDVCNSLDISVKTKDRWCDIYRNILWRATGEEMTPMACKHLRAREFAEADSAIQNVNREA